MTSEAPLFSIIMPTRNRAHILFNALRSALNQTFDDYEIVVMANNCSDNTREVVASLATSRVRYYETDSTLSMPDNWEYAWTKARGKYITYLSDDDALVPEALEVIAKSALKDSPPVVSWEDAIYYYPSENEKTEDQNLLLLFFFGHLQIEDVDSSTLLAQLAQFEFSWTASIPKMNNSAVNRSFWDEQRSKLGRIFFPLAPDYSFAWLSTQICPSIRIIRQPLSVRGISDNSIGANANLGKAGQNFFKEFNGVDFFADSPIDLPTSMNIIFGTFSQINQAFIKCGMKPHSVCPKALIMALTKQIVEFHYLLPDHQKYFDILLTKAGTLSEDFKTQVNNLILKKTVEVKPQSASQMHNMTRKSTLEFLPALKNELLVNGQNLPAALCKLGLRDDAFTDPHWSCMYVFGDALSINNIYELSKLVKPYYNFLVQNRNKADKWIENKTWTRRVINRTLRKFYKMMSFGIATHG